MADYGDNATVPASPMGAMLTAIGAQYPRLQPHLQNMAVQWGSPVRNTGGGHLEFYPPWESANPNPGRPTIELFDRGLKGNGLQDAIAGDALHMLGAVDPRSGQAVDPQFNALKQRVVAARSPRQENADQRAYSSAQAGGDGRSFDDWMQDSRGDAYVRGYVTPDAQDQWRGMNDWYTRPQKNALGDIIRLLGTQAPAPGLPAFDIPGNR